jgi:hypothetical protein
MSCFAYFTYCNGQRLVSIYYPKTDKSNKIFSKTVPSYLALDQSMRHDAKSSNTCPNRTSSRGRRKKSLESYEDVLRIKKSLNTFHPGNYKCGRNCGTKFST